jgi:hypothetical protein
MGDVHVYFSATPGRLRANSHTRMHANKQARTVGLTFMLRMLEQTSFTEILHISLEILSLSQPTRVVCF